MIFQTKFTYCLHKKFDFGELKYKETELWHEIFWICKHLPNYSIIIKRSGEACLL